MDLAAHFEGEIISADSWTVYRGFDIGTAKPSAEERAQIRHHLIDVADPRDGFNAVLFKRLALAAVADIEQRGKLPILAGGTNLYINSVIYDYSFLPPVPLALRESRNNLTLSALLREAEASGINLDGIDTRNKRRVIRALESGGQRPGKTELRPYTLLLGIRTERDDLRERITRRVEAMLAQGLENEVKALSRQYGWEVEPMKGIGYGEWREYFDGSQTLAQTRERIISDSMNLAKRQRTWFKRNDSIQWVHDPRQAVDIATTYLNKKR